MHIQITLDKEDWKSFLSHVEKELAKNTKNWTDSILFNVAIWAIIAFTIMFLIKRSGEVHWPTASGVAALFVIFIIIFFARMVKLRNASAPSEDGIFLGEHEYIFDDDGINSKGKYYESSHKWASVMKIERANGIIIIYLDTLFAFILPEKKLDNPNKIYEFICGKYKKYNNSFSRDTLTRAR